VPHREWHLRIEDMLDAIEAIGRFIEGMTYEDFLLDRKTVDAVLRNITVIGEAVARLPDDIQAGVPEVPWRDMRDMRNVVVHEYFGVNKRILWETALHDLPPLVSALRAAVRQ
jgi:uncharacterized protein with HEPN domain